LKTEFLIFDVDCTEHFYDRATVKSKWISGNLLFINVYYQQIIKK